MFILSDFFRLITRYRLKLILLFAAAVWGTVWVWPASKLTLVFCSVGQGDASIVSRGFTQVLIDSGPANPKTADCLGRRLPFFDHRLEAVIISHPQTDHFAGLPEVLKRYQVDKFIFNGIAGDSRAWVQLSQLVEAEKSQVITLSADDKLKIGEIEIDVLWPKTTIDDRRLKVGVEDRKLKVDNQGNLSSIIHLPPLSSTVNHPSSNVLGVSSFRDLNADALVLALSYGDFSALFTGDIGEKEENQMVKRLNGQTAENFNRSNRSSRLTVLKVAHHGSKTSSSSEFLEAVRPALAVIEVGKNSYGHPADEVLKRLETIGAKVLRTDRDGDVVVETDGKRWETSTISN